MRLKEYVFLPLLLILVILFISNPGEEQKPKTNHILEDYFFGEPIYVVIPDWLEKTNQEQLEKDSLQICIPKKSLELEGLEASSVSFDAERESFFFFNHVDQSFYRVDSNGKQERLLEKPLGYDEEISWSPDKHMVMIYDKHTMKGMAFLDFQKKTVIPIPKEPEIFFLGWLPSEGHGSVFWQGKWTENCRIVVNRYSNWDPIPISDPVPLTDQWWMIDGKLAIITRDSIFFTTRRSTWAFNLGNREFYHVAEDLKPISTLGETVLWARSEDTKISYLISSGRNPPRLVWTWDGEIDFKYWVDENLFVCFFVGRSKDYQISKSGYYFCQISQDGLVIQKIECINMDGIPLISDQKGLWTFRADGPFESPILKFFSPRTTFRYYQLPPPQYSEKTALSPWPYYVPVIAIFLFILSGSVFWIRRMKRI